MDYPPTAVVSTFYKALTDQGTDRERGSREAEGLVKMEGKEEDGREKELWWGGFSERSTTVNTYNTQVWAICTWLNKGTV